METNAVIDKVLNKYGNTVKVFSALTTIALLILAAGNVWSFYKDSIWVPSVTVVSFDFTGATAIVMISGTQCNLYGNSTLAAGGSWGVRFGTKGLSEAEGYNTIELVKDDMVYSVLQSKTTT